MPRGKSLLLGNMMLEVLTMFSGSAVMEVADGASGSGVEEAGIVVKMVEGPALLSAVLAVLSDQRSTRYTWGLTHGSRTVVEGDNTSPASSVVEVPATVPTGAIGVTATSTLLDSEIAAGAISPMMPSRKGKVPDLAVPVEAGSTRVIEVGTEIVEKIPASLSSSLSLSTRSKGTCSQRDSYWITGVEWKLSRKMRSTWWLYRS
jgi:hypothetical protein